MRVVCVLGLLMGALSIEQWQDMYMVNYLGNTSKECGSIHLEGYFVVPFNPLNHTRTYHKFTNMNTSFSFSNPEHSVSGRGQGIVSIPFDDHRNAFERSWVGYVNITYFNESYKETITANLHFGEHRGTVIPFNTSFYEGECTLWGVMKVEPFPPPPIPPTPQYDMYFKGETGCKNQNQSKKLYLEGKMAFPFEALNHTPSYKRDVKVNVSVGAWSEKKTREKKNSEGYALIPYDNSSNALKQPMQLFLDVWVEGTGKYEKYNGVLSFHEEKGFHMFNVFSVHNGSCSAHGVIYAQPPGHKGNNTKGRLVVTNNTGCGIFDIRGLIFAPFNMQHHRPSMKHQLPFKLLLNVSNKEEMSSEWGEGYLEYDNSSTLVGKILPFTLKENKNSSRHLVVNITGEENLPKQPYKLLFNMHLPNYTGCVYFGYIEMLEAPHPDPPPPPSNKTHKYYSLFRGNSTKCSGRNERIWGRMESNYSIVGERHSPSERKNIQFPVQMNVTWGEGLYIGSATLYKDKYPDLKHQNLPVVLYTGLNKTHRLEGVFHFGSYLFNRTALHLTFNIDHKCEFVGVIDRSLPLPIPPPPPPHNHTLERYFMTGNMQFTPSLSNSTRFNISILQIKEKGHFFGFNGSLHYNYMNGTIYLNATAKDVALYIYGSVAFPSNYSEPVLRGQVVNFQGPMPITGGGQKEGPWTVIGNCTFVPHNKLIKDGTLSMNGTLYKSL